MLHIMFADHFFLKKTCLSYMTVVGSFNWCKKNTGIHIDTDTRRKDKSVNTN